ncbi:CLUMA_CG010356, isoform A [Clunio marinus]|uniref:CLUMA_CG010356, isoform A n=1 Tax=Clunio marinus TaxID=568069 RepID=A0A1J1I9S9_9DIPT|nr:CLUMA_CG010356, isoform A [Clunio marinus]
MLLFREENTSRKEKLVTLLIIEDGAMNEPLIVHHAYHISINLQKHDHQFTFVGERSECQITSINFPTKKKKLNENNGSDYKYG